MPEKKLELFGYKELTDEQIKEAIEKKHCPYCKSRKFVGDFPAWQRFEFGYDSNNIPKSQPDFAEPNTSAAFEQVECTECEREIPEIIWREWIEIEAPVDPEIQKLLNSDAR